MKNKICEYSDTDGYDIGNPWVNEPYALLEKNRRNPNGAKPKRVICPKCGRKMMSQVRCDMDGLDRIDCIPPHKIKGWWKKGKKRVAKDRNKGQRGK